MGLMYILYFIYLGIFLGLVVKDVDMPFARLLKHSLPLMIEEKIMIKNYYGVENLFENTRRYSEKALNNLVLSLPLLALALIFNTGLLLLTLPLMFWAYRYQYLMMKKKIKHWKIDFYKIYPSFLNDLKMYLQSGLTLENSLKLYFEKGTNCHYLELLRLSIIKINFGKSRKEAFIEVINHTRERELIHLINYFMQFIQLGTEDLSYLNHLSDEAWKLKKETVKKLAEEGSAKMVLPMMIIFIGITILILVPSLFTLMDKKIL